MAGNNNSGNLSKKQLTTTPIGIELINSTGAETLIPGLEPPAPPDIQMIGRLQFGSDKPGKDTNFRGITIFGNTLYLSKGSGGNGINTVIRWGPLARCQPVLLLSLLESRLRFCRDFRTRLRAPRRDRLARFHLGCSLRTLIRSMFATKETASTSAHQSMAM